MKLYKVQDLAERYGMTRQSIHYYLDKLSFEEKNKFISYKGKIILINKNGVNHLDNLIKPLNVIKEETQENDKLADVSQIQQNAAFLRMIRESYASKLDLTQFQNQILKDQKQQFQDINADIKSINYDVINTKKNLETLSKDNKQLKKYVVILASIIVLLIIVLAIVWFNTFEI